MNDKKTEALKLAQKALEELLAEKSYWWQEVDCDIVKALEKAESICKQALAEQPANQLDDINVADIPKIGCVNHDCDKCKAQQQQEPSKPWVGLTDEDTRKINQEVWGYVSADHTRMWDYARAIEAKLREKNHG